MINSLNALNNLSKLDSSFKDSSPKQFNATLPILLKVLAKTKGDTYLLKLGSQNIETKSNLKLEIGKNYWSNMSKNAAGQIILNNLKAAPNLINFTNSANLKFELSDLNILSNNAKEFNNEFKEFLLNTLSNATSKEEFKEISFLLMSLKEGVLTLNVNKDGKNHLIQIKKQKKQALDFYVIFPHLGEISGVIFLDSKDNLDAIMYVMNEKVKHILESNADKLGFNLKVESNNFIAPLYDFNDSLLDIRG